MVRQITCRPFLERLLHVLGLFLKGSQCAENLQTVVGAFFDRLFMAFGQFAVRQNTRRPFLDGFLSVLGTLNNCHFWFLVCFPIQQKKMPNVFGGFSVQGRNPERSTSILSFVEKTKMLLPAVFEWCLEGFLMVLR